MEIDRTWQNIIHICPHSCFVFFFDFIAVYHPPIQFAVFVVTRMSCSWLFWSNLRICAEGLFVHFESFWFYSHMWHSLNIAIQCQKMPWITNHYVTWTSLLSIPQLYHARGSAHSSFSSGCRGERQRHACGTQGDCVRECATWGYSWHWGCLVGFVDVGGCWWKDSDVDGLGMFGKCLGLCGNVCDFPWFSSLSFNIFEP